MAKPRTREYRSESIVVRFELARCIHAAECVHGLPEVFDPDRRPWVDPQRGETDRIAEVVGRCPTGALSFERLDGGPEERPAAANSARPSPDGPLYLRGDLRIHTADGKVRRGTRAALCRCGATGNAPFCDGSHVEAGFTDPGGLGAAGLGGEAGEAEPGAPLEVRLAPNGPLLIQGPVTLRAAEGADAQQGAKGALCRCGASGNKPYCDGSHVAAGFRG